MASDRAVVMAQEVARLSKTAAKRRRGPMPRQQAPLGIEKGYAKAVRAIMAPAFGAFAVPIFSALPELVRDADPVRARRVVDNAYGRMIAALSESTIEITAARFARQVADFNAKQLGRQVRAALGVEVAVPDRSRAKLTRNFISTNVTYLQDVAEELSQKVGKLLAKRVPQHARLDAKFDIKKVPAGLDRDLLARLVEEAYDAGDLTRTLAEDIEDTFAGAAGRSERIARDQIGTLNSQVNQARQREMGVDKYYWRTMNDERVRDSHAAMEGVLCSYSNPPIVDGEPANPGEPPMCRCYPEPDFDEVLGLTDE